MLININKTYVFIEKQVLCYQYRLKNIHMHLSWLDGYE